MNHYKNKLAIIGTVGVPARYGGFETLAHQLVLHLNNQFELTVYNSTKHYSAKDRPAQWKGAKIKYIPFSANGIQSILYDIFSIIHAILFCDILLILGVSGCLFLPIVKLLFPWKRIMVNIDGLEWRRAKWGKFAKQFLLFSEKVAIHFADEIIADNSAIQKYVFDRYGVNSNLIEYGADHNQKEEITPACRKKFPFLEQDYAFKVARIEPENNIHIILKAFANQEKLPLVLIGNWDNQAYGRALRKKYANVDHLHLIDPIYDPVLLNQLRSNAKVYIHGHGEGGTNPSLVEAMYLGLPVFAFNVIYNKVTTENQAYYFKTAEGLVKMIQSIDVFDLNKTAKELSMVAFRRYRWSVIANKYAALAMDRARKPDPVFDFELPSKLQQAIG